MTEVPASTTSLFAYSFKTELTLAQIFARLNEAGPWRWIERDGHYWGDYLSSVALRGVHTAELKIFEEPDHYVVQMKFESEAPNAAAELATLRTTLFEKVLPAIGARDLTPTDTYD